MTGAEDGWTEGVLVVIPAWNEELALESTIAELRSVHADLELVVVDDGSSDRTAQVARSLGERVLSLPYNIGVGGAMRAGFLFAVRNGYEVVVQFDADGQHDPRDIQGLVAGVRSGSDVVVGSRFHGAAHYQVRGLRWVAMRFLARSVSAFTRTDLSDVTSGFRATGPTALPVFARSYPAEYLGDTVESLLIAHRTGLRISQVAVGMRPRVAGAPSHSSWRSVPYLGRAVLVLFLGLVRRKSTVGA